MNNIRNYLLSSTVMNKYAYNPTPVNPHFAKWMLDKNISEMEELAVFWHKCGRPE